jgi:hypothetical protein
VLQGMGERRRRGDLSSYSSSSALLKHWRQRRER